MTAHTTDDVQAVWAAAHVKPLWEIEQAHRTGDDGGGPVIWPWRTMEPLVTRAIDLASPAVAERRVLSLIDPAARPGEFHTITNLNAGLQILLPGEVARPHRHSMDALRFILAGSGAVTRVDGKLAPMAFGDLVLTPGMCWHEHWHEGTEPMVWLDVLNVHTHITLGTMHFEPGPVHDVPARPADAAFANANVVPEIAPSDVSPVFRYPLAAAQAAVDVTPAGPDGAHRARYVNPLTGGPVMPLLDCSLVKIDAGTETRPLRTSAHTVYAVISGRGSTTAGATTVEWEPRDVFTVPHGAPIRHRADETSYLFAVTDREVYRRLGLLAEEFVAV
jgi:gentisate 1,2-dioxygenase